MLCNIVCDFEVYVNCTSQYYAIMKLGNLKYEFMSHSKKNGGLVSNAVYDVYNWVIILPWSKDVM